MNKQYIYRDYEYNRNNCSYSSEKNKKVPIFYSDVKPTHLFEF